MIFLEAHPHLLEPVAGHLSTVLVEGIGKFFAEGEAISFDLPLGVLLLQLDHPELSVVLVERVEHWKISGPGLIELVSHILPSVVLVIFKKPASRQLDIRIY